MATPAIIIDKRIVLPNAVQYRGVSYDISIGLENHPFTRIPPVLPQQIEILVSGCIHALQQQLSQADAPANLERLVFVIQKQSETNYQSRMFLAPENQTTLEIIKQKRWGSFHPLSFQTMRISLSQPDKDRARWCRELNSIHDVLIELHRCCSSVFEIPVSPMPASS